MPTEMIKSPKQFCHSLEQIQKFVTSCKIVIGLVLDVKCFFFLYYLDPKRNIHDQTKTKGHVNVTQLSLNVSIQLPINSIH